MKNLSPWLQCLQTFLPFSPENRAQHPGSSARLTSSSPGCLCSEESWREKTPRNEKAVFRNDYRESHSLALGNLDMFNTKFAKKICPGERHCPRARPSPRQQNNLLESSGVLASGENQNCQHTPHRIMDGWSVCNECLFTRCCGETAGQRRTL